MLVSSDSWHAKVYRWWYARKFNIQDASELPRHTNLCPYMRVVLFWAWLRWLFIDGEVTVRGQEIPIPPFIIIFLLIEIPRWVGMVSYGLKNVLWTVEGIAALVVLVVFIILAISQVHEHYGVFNPIIRGARVTRRGVSSFDELVTAYLRAAHDRVCPEIQFDRTVEPPGSASWDE